MYFVVQRAIFPLDKKKVKVQHVVLYLRTQLNLGFDRSTYTNSRRNFCKKTPEIFLKFSNRTWVSTCHAPKLATPK